MKMKQVVHDYDVAFAVGLCVGMVIGFAIFMVFHGMGCGR